MILLGFKFNEVHSNSVGLIMRSKNRPILPEPKIVSEEIPARHGVYDFSAANPYGRIMYREREISVDCKFVSQSVSDMRLKAREIASWLSCGEARLVFDDDPNVFFLAKVVNRIDFEQQMSKIGSFTIVFSCRPFAHSVAMSGEVPSYGNGLAYGGRLFYGGYNRFAVDNDGITPGHDPVINLFGMPTYGFPSVEFNVENFGTYVKPKIEFEGVFDNVRISFGNLFIKLPQNASGTLCIDCEKRKVVLNGMNITNNIIGSFFELAPGNNIMSISSDNVDCDLIFSFNNLYL